MTKRTAALTSMILLALGIAAFTGSALAGKGNGNGQASTQSVSADQSASAVTPEALAPTVVLPVVPVVVPVVVPPVVPLCEQEVVE